MSKNDSLVEVKAFLLNKREAYEKVLKETGQDLRKTEIEGMLKGFESNFEAILERRKKIEGAGILYTELSKFSALLDEAVKTYELGFYNSTIAICGTIAERICYDFIDMLEIHIFLKSADQATKETLYEIPFRHLLEFLTKINAFGEIDKKKLYEIYDIRNQYVHPKRMGDVEGDAIKVLNMLCEVLENVFSIFRFYDVKDGQFVKKGMQLDVETPNITPNSKS